MNSISTPVKMMAVAAVFLQAMAHKAGAQEFYSTGFEPADFALGQVDGQDGWFGAAKVQIGVVESGIQALHIDGSVEGGFAGRGMDSAVGSDLFRLQADYRRTGKAGQSGIFLYGDTGFIAQLAETTSGFILGNTDSNTAPQVFKADTWHHLIIELDFLEDTLTGFVDGQQLGTIAINTLPEPTRILGFQLYFLGLGQAQQSIYFDNFSFSTSTIPAVPETSTMLMLPGLGCLLVLGAWRRRTSHASRGV